MTSFFNEDDIERKIKWHEEEIMTSHPYKQSLNYMKRLIEDFKKGLVLIRLAATREYSSYNESALMFGITDFIGSVIAIETVSKELVLNAPKRELRYMLEATIKYAAVDEYCKGKTLEEKLNYLYTEIPRSSINPINDITNLSESMVTDTKELYSLLSQFIHPSKKQLTEYKIQLEKGRIGFETHKEIDQLNRLLFRTFDTILYITLKTMGSYVTKDFFYALRDEEKWRFYTGKHVKTLPNKYRTI